MHAAYSHTNSYEKLFSANVYYGGVTHCGGGGDGGVGGEKTKGTL